MMTISTIRLTCQCGHVFDAEIVTEAPISVAVASMKAVRCPKCGNSELSLGGERNSESKPSLSTPVGVRSDWWIDNGETGTSSLTIYSAFCEGREPHHSDVPHDPDDYRRCRLLFDLIPEWRRNLTPLVTRYPWFAPFAQAWDTMDRLYDLEAPVKRCPKLYELMKHLETESRKLRLGTNAT